MNFYNEIDPYSAQWLRNLIAAGLLAPGIVDVRLIQEIEPWELLGFTQCHFFCGIGVWPYALRVAGWPDDEPIWTGSCPCQPFSQAGKQKGFSDGRHLWPYWKNLIAECRPSRVIGEQVASALNWLDLIQTDLEASDYAFGASDLCASGFGGSHIRQRLYFVGLADALRSGQPGPGAYRHASNYSTGRNREINRAFNDGEWGSIVGLDNTPSRYASAGRQQYGSPRSVLYPRQTRSIDDADWLLCRNPAGEPSWRPVEPGTFPLAHGVASRMGKLRAYGNALDAETAIAFCQAVAEIVGIRPLAEYDL